MSELERATKEELIEFHRDLSEVMAHAGYVQKDGSNDFAKYRYASADAVLSKVREILAPKGIAVRCDVERPEWTENTKGTPIATVRLQLSFVRGLCVHHTSGLGSGSDKGDKAVMKATTAAVKYALSGGFLISWGDDPEADESTDRDVSPRRNSKTDKTGKQKVEGSRLTAEVLSDKIQSVTNLNDANLLKPEVSKWRDHDKKVYNTVKDQLLTRIEELKAKEAA